MARYVPSAPSFICFIMGCAVVYFLKLPRIHRSKILHGPWNKFSGPLDSYGCNRISPIPGLQFDCFTSVSVERMKRMNLKQRRDTYFGSILRKHLVCNKTELLGNPGEGGWWACMEGPFQWSQNNCIVYSFGIARDWSFDDTADHKYGCTVNSFDPTIHKKDHKHSDLVTFHNAGLSDQNVEKNSKGWKTRTLCTFIKEIGHQNMVIDYVKFDIEFSEWSALRAMLEEGCLPKIKQLGFEIHSWNDTADAYVDFWTVLQGIEKVGFQRWHWRTRDNLCFKPKDNPKKRYCPQVDMAYINANFLD